MAKAQYPLYSGSEELFELNVSFPSIVSFDNETVKVNPPAQELLATFVGTKVVIWFFIGRTDGLRSTDVLILWVNKLSSFGMNSSDDKESLALSPVPEAKNKEGQ